MRLTEEQIQAKRDKWPSVPEFAIVKTREKKSSPTNELTHQVMEFINQQTGCYCFRVNVGGVIREGRYTPSQATKGVSDLIACKYPSGRLIAIEIKGTKSDKQRDAQKKWQKRIEAAGGIYILCRDLESLKFIWNNLK